MAIFYAIVLATGVLAIGVAVMAASKGYSLAELYTDTFPTFRGGAEPASMPAVVYLIFFGYVVGTAEIAILYRRRIARRWLDRR